jgi:O-antigen/teichoic acid export membrane protein
MAISVIKSAHAALRSRFLRNVGWLAGAEAVSRITRLVAAIALARTLSPAAFGAAAIAITTFELIRLFNQNGVGAAVIRAADEALPGLCLTAHRFSWALSVILVAAQCLAGWALGAATGDPDIAWMVAALSGVYLFMPSGVVHAWILQRGERFSRLASVNAVQLATDNFLTAALAIAGFGPWAIVLPKLLTAPIWLIGVSWGRPWRPERNRPAAPLGPLVKDAAPVLGSELLAASRLHLDKALIGLIYGVEALGVYFFAFNAGLGLSGSLGAAFTQALYPHLCEARRRVGSALALSDRSLARGGAALGAIFIAQAIAAPFYVPIVFGADWAFAAPLVAIFCLGGPAKLITDASGQLLRAEGRLKTEMGLAAFVTFFTLAWLLLGAQISAEFAVYGVTAGAILSALIALPAARVLASVPSTSHKEVVI